jgi:hypothetical protein
LECGFGVVGKVLMSRIQWNLFGKIWIQNVGDRYWVLSDFYHCKIQINFKKPGFGRKNQLRKW